MNSLFSWLGGRYVALYDSAAGAFIAHDQPCLRYNFGLNTDDLGFDARHAYVWIYCLSSSCQWVLGRCSAVL